MSRRLDPSPFGWAPPAIVGWISGVILQAGGLSLMASAGAAALALLPLCFAFVRQRLGRPLLGAMLVAILLVPAGYLRTSQRIAWQDPLAPAVNRMVVLEGRSDGRLLHLQNVGSVVAVRPAGVMPRGFVRVQGLLTPAQGQRNPGGFDERAWLQRRGGSLVLRQVTLLHARTDAEGFRGRLRAALVLNLSPRAAQLMRALVLGEREDASELRDTFARSGFAHLLALSGLHLSVLAGIVAWLLRGMGRMRGLWIAVVSIAFTIWVGPSPSLVRAASMISVVSLTLALERNRPSPLETIALAALGTLLIRPDWLQDLAFQLSYLALLGILAWGVPLAKRWAPRRPTEPSPLEWLSWTGRNLLTGGFAVSGSAWLAGLPWVIDAFGEVAVAGLALNLIAVPLTTVLLPLGLASALLGALHPILATIVNLATEPLAKLLILLADLGAGLPSVSGSGVDAIGKGLFVLACFPWAWTLRYRLAAWRAALVTAAALATALLISNVGTGTLDRPEFIALDVGQGDSFLLRFPTGDAILIDGGGTPFSDYEIGAAIVVPALRNLGVHRLTWVLSTHADMDHAEGLSTVLRRLEVDALGYGVAQPGRPSWDRLHAIARAERIPMQSLQRGQSLSFGQARVHVLHPSAASVAGHEDDPNAKSLALRVDWRGVPWLMLLGDLPSEVDAQLALLPVPVVVAAHHGSSDATSAALLAATKPEKVVISVGFNAYGHPSPAVLDRAREVGATVLRTDELGAIRLQPAW